MVDGECFVEGGVERWAEGRRVGVAEVLSFGSMKEALAWARSASTFVEVGLDGDGRRFWAGDGAPPDGMTALEEAPLPLVELVMRQWGRHRARQRLPDLTPIRIRFEQLFPRWRRGGVGWELHGRLHLGVVEPTDVEQVELLELAEELGFIAPVIERLILSAEEAAQIERALRDGRGDGLHGVRVDCRTGQVELFVEAGTEEATVAAARRRFPERSFVAVPSVSVLRMTLGHFGADRPPDVGVVW